MPAFLTDTSPLVLAIAPPRDPLYIAVRLGACVRCVLQHADPVPAGSPYHTHRPTCKLESWCVFKLHKSKVARGVRIRNSSVSSSFARIGVIAQQCEHFTSGHTVRLEYGTEIAVSAQTMVFRPLCERHANQQCFQRRTHRAQSPRFVRSVVLRVEILGTIGTTNSHSHTSLHHSDFPIQRIRTIIIFCNIP